MSSSIDSFNAQFVIVSLGIVMPFLVVTLGFCYRSRCKQVNLCYRLLNIQRDTQAEVTSDLTLTRNNNLPNFPNINLSSKMPVQNYGLDVGISGPLPEAINRV